MNPEPDLWRTSGFWAAAWVLLMFVAVLRGVSGKDEAGRRAALRRVLLVAGVLWLLLHGRALLGLWTGYRGVQLLGMRTTPTDWARAWLDALQTSLGAWALLGATVAVAGLASIPAGSGRFARWGGPLLAGALLLVVAFEVHGTWARRTDPSTSALLLHVKPAPPWIEGARLLAGLTALAAALMVAARGLAYPWRVRTADPGERERLRGSLVLWGGLLFIAAAIGLLGRAMDLMREVALLGPRFPGWATTRDAFLRSALPVPLALGFLGLLALCFGSLHLRHRGKGGP